MLGQELRCSRMLGDPVSYLRTSLQEGRIKGPIKGWGELRAEPLNQFLVDPLFPLPVGLLGMLSCPKSFRLSFRAC